MAIQFLPQYMWGGLSGMAPGMAAMGQGMGQWFTPEARTERQRMGIPSPWIDPYTLQFTPGTKRSVVKEYEPQIQYDPKRPGTWGYSPVLSPGWKRVDPKVGLAPDWGAPPEGGWPMAEAEHEPKAMPGFTPRFSSGFRPETVPGYMPGAEEGMAVTGDWLPRFLSAPSTLSQSLFDQMHQGASKQIGGPVKRQGGTNLLLDLIGFEKDEIPILAHEGEVVLRKEAVDVLGGPHEVDALNKMFDAGQQGAGVTQKKGMPTAQAGMAVTGPKEEEEMLKNAMLFRMMGFQGQGATPPGPTPPGLGGGNASLGVNVPQAPPGYEEFARVFRQKYAHLGPITEEYVQEAWRQSLQAHPENPMITLTERPGEIPGGLKTTDEYVELPPIGPGDELTIPRAWEGNLAEQFFQKMPPLPREGTPEKPSVKPKAGAKGEGPIGPVAAPTPPPQPAAPGWRAPGSAMPVDWQAISQMDPAAVAQYLQTMAQTQGQLPLGQMDPQAAASMTMPRSQQLFGQLMGQYGGLQGAEVSASAVRKARLETDKYWSGVMKDAQDMRDAELANIAMRTRQAESNMNLIDAQIDNPQGMSALDLEKLRDYKFDRLKPLMDDFLTIANKTNKPADWRRYFEVALEYEFFRDDAAMEAIKTDGDYKKIIDRYQTISRKKGKLTKDIIDDIIVKVKRQLASGGGGDTVEILLQEAIKERGGQ